MGIEQISEPKLPWSARITFGLGFGFALAANSLQGENPVSGLAVIVILPALFVLGLVAGIVIAGFARRPAWLSPARSLLTAALLSIAMAAGAYARGLLYLRHIAATEIPRYGGAETLSEQYVTPLLPRLVSVKLRTDQPPQAIFDYYDRRLRASGWANASFAPPYWGSWTDSRRNRLQLEIAPNSSGVFAELIWTRYLP